MWWFLSQSEKESCYDYPVDMVYTWCDGNEEKLCNLRNYWKEKLNIKSLDSSFWCQWDSHDELKYSIRSLEKFASWIRTIYILTYSQKPAWFTNYNEKGSPGYIPTKPTLKIVDLREFMPHEALPTFNSMAIEAYLPLIKGLAEHFLYANDDMFFNCPVDKSFFYDLKGRPIVRLSSKISSGAMKRSLHVRRVKAAQEEIKKRYNKRIEYLPHHSIDAYTKTIFLDCINEFKEDFKNTTFHKFRREDSIQRSIVLYRALATKQAVMRRTKGLFKHTDTAMVGTNSPFKLVFLKDPNIKLSCINDDSRASEADKKIIQDFLDQKYPDKSIYEIPQNAPSEKVVLHEE